MPQVVINGASFGQRITGVQRYTREMSTRLLAYDGVRLALPIPAPDFVAPPGADVRVLRSRRVMPGGAWTWVNTTLRGALGPDDVLWSPTVRAPLVARNHVPTVHDLSALDHPEWFRPAVRYQWRTLVPPMCRRAAHVITDSAFSRDRIVERLGVPLDRITVVPCGVDPRFGRASTAEVTELRARLGLPERFVLSLGSADPRKNIALLLDAWRSMPASHRGGAGLVLAGGEARTFAVVRAAQETPDGVLRLGYVADSDLPALYAAATLFVYPSRYEGFGLPPLEAMAAGTPVVALASTAAVAEVVGDAGVLVTDGSPEGVADGLATLLRDDGRAAELAIAGQSRAARYTWDAAAHALLAVLRAVSGSG